MVDIVTSNFYLIAGEYDKKDFEAYSIDLFEKWSSDVKGRSPTPSATLGLMNA
jgi:hypothetical protein